MSTQWTRTHNGRRLTLTRDHHPDRGNMYEITEGGLSLAAFDEEQARALYAMLAEALGEDVAALRAENKRLTDYIEAERQQWLYDQRAR